MASEKEKEEEEVEDAGKEELNNGHLDAAHNLTNDEYLKFGRIRALRDSVGGLASMSICGGLNR